MFSVQRVRRVPISAGNDAPPYILPNTCCQGFGHLVAAFTGQNVTHDMLPELSDNDMRKLKNLRFSPIYDTIFTVKKVSTVLDYSPTQYSTG